MRNTFIVIMALLASGLIQAQNLDFGDAPEGVIAYPRQGIIGMFPTCKTVGPSNWIQHTNFGAFFGPGIDFEGDGNAGFCPQFPPYDADECYADNDAGLAFPQPYTISPVPFREVLCPNSRGTSLGLPCAVAAWGQSIDIFVVNKMPNKTTGFVNILFDWDRNGLWAGASPCPQGPAPEHVLVNFPVPQGPTGFSGMLSTLGPPPFLIGPLRGFIWARFSITERPVALPWFGDGAFEDGESEDYLIYIGDYEFGDAPEGALAYPASGIIGNFPTCMNVGAPGTFVRHTPGAAFWGPKVDGENEGNASFCPAFAPNMYDRDECFQDGDAGLLTPTAYTIIGNLVVPCIGPAGKPLDKFCATAQWGPEIDIAVTGPGFVNILMDWDQNGNWAFNPASVCAGIPVPEHVLVDFPVPPGFSGPLSALFPPPIPVGPNAGFVWTRFTLSDVPLANPNWNGIGDFLDGETEDYLLEVSLTSGLKEIRGETLPFKIIPNPAQDAFRIELGLLNAEDLRIDLMGLEGRVMRTLYDAGLPKGVHTLEFNLKPDELPNGLYLIRLQSASGKSGYQRLVIQRT